jgi:hypothetical protein
MNAEHRSNIIIIPGERHGKDGCPSREQRCENYSTAMHCMRLLTRVNRELLRHSLWICGCGCGFRLHAFKTV